jgi:hypothetical protein
VASAQGCLGNVDAQAPTGAGDEPDLLLSHGNDPYLDHERPQDPSAGTRRATANSSTARGSGKGRETNGRERQERDAFPIDEAADLGVPDQWTEALVEEIRADALDDFDLVRQEAPDAPLDRWHAYLESGFDAQASQARTPCLVHNDLAAEHVLCDPAAGSVTGIIDWSDVAIGDPAADLAGMFHWGGEELASAVLSQYEREADAALRARARFMAACRGVADVAFGVDTRRREYVAAGLRALQLCAGGS